MRIEKLRQEFDLVLIACLLSVFFIGIMSITSATYRSADLFPELLLRQLRWFLIGVVCFALVLVFGYQRMVEFAGFFYISSAALLILVLLAAEQKMGSQRWIELGFFSFQPSEVAKLAVALMLARYLGRASFKNVSEHGNRIFLSLVLVVLPIALIVKHPDLGTALSLIPVAVVVLLLWGVGLKLILSFAGIGLLSMPLIWQVLRDYQKQRILTFLNPHADPLGSGYTVIQSKIAIGSGGLFGKGWLNGTQSQLNFLPVRHADFVFSVYGEEWGFIGAVVLITLYFIIIRRSLLIVQQTHSLTARLLGGAVITFFSFQVFVNLAMTMGLLPVVGLPLPLMSYGGSSLVVTLVGFALLLSIKQKSIG